MNSRQALGLVVAAVVLTGAYLARANHLAPHVDETSATAAAQPAGVPPPDVTLADQTVTSGELRVTLSVMPRPVAAFRPFTVRVRAESRGRAVVLDDAHATFAMDMPMGVPRVALARSAEWNEGTVQLPLCFSGGGGWTVIIDGHAGDRIVAARFHLDLARPVSWTE